MSAKSCKKLAEHLVLQKPDSLVFWLAWALLNIPKKKIKRARQD